MKKGIYFSELDEERAYSLNWILEDMKEQGLTELKVYTAVREIGTEYFYCFAINDIGIKPPEGEPCGNNCENYEPRNGKNGCCKNRGYCYTPDKEFILTIDGKLKEIL